MSKVNSTFFRSVLAVSAALIVGANAQAGETKSPLVTTVAYDDLNVANKRDAEELYSRLQDATKQVCAPYVASQNNRMVAKRTCYHQVLGRAVRDVKAEQLTQVHARAVNGSSSDDKLAVGGGSGSKLSK